jgi:hypothetical protein
MVRTRKDMSVDYAKLRSEKKGKNKKYVDILQLRSSE